LPSFGVLIFKNPTIRKYLNKLTYLFSKKQEANNLHMKTSFQIRYLPVLCRMLLLGTSDLAIKKISSSQLILITPHFHLISSPKLTFLLDFPSIFTNPKQ